MTTEVRNFACFEQRSLAATTTTGGGNFTTSNGQLAKQCRIVNTGTVGAQVSFGATAQTALNTASAGGSAQYYVAAGEDIVIEKETSAIFYAAITDTGTTTLIFHAGEGS